jgi:hypothetical protein
MKEYVKRVRVRPFRACGRSLRQVRGTVEDSWVDSDS